MMQEHLEAAPKLLDCEIPLFSRVRGKSRDN